MEKKDKKNKRLAPLIIFVVVGLIFTAMPISMARAEVINEKGEEADIEKDSEGHLHMAYQDEFEPGSFEIFYTNNIGLKKGEWNPSIKITDTLSDSLEPDLGIDSITGTMFITWTEQCIEGDFIYSSISRDNGKSWSEPRKMDYEIILKTDVFDPLIEEPEIPSELKLHESQGYYIVQLKSRLVQEWYDTMDVIDGTIYDYIPNNAFLVEMNEDVKKIVEDMPYTRWIGFYHPAYKIQKGLMDKTGRIEVNVIIFRDDGNRENLIRVINEIYTLGGEIKHDGMDNYIIVAEIDTEMIDELAFIPEVAWIDESGLPIPDMNHIRDFTGADFWQTPPNDYDGGGYIVGEVRDFGIDLPQPGDLDPPSHEDLTAINITHTQGEAYEYDDKGRHGTPVSGILFGNGEGLADAKGMLPNAEGAFANYWDTTRTSSIVQLDAWGGVFQSNSWHVGTLNSVYSAVSSEDDLLVFTYDITMLYSAGNSQDGVDAETLSQDSVAKNVICVGGLFHQDTVAENDDKWEDHGVSSTPSQGPTVDGRIKPDITGPYDAILTTDSVDGDSNNGYVAGDYAIFSGTSFATPVVAGAIGIINQMYDDNYFDNNPTGDFPHAATAKALVINSARQIDVDTPGLSSTEGDGRFQQGWGMVDLDNRLANTDLDYLIVDEASNLLEDESDTYTIHVRNSLQPLKISLVWTDPPGSYTPTGDVFNNLDLEVTDLTTESVYWGNNGLITSRWSSAGGSGDTLNNVENVFIENPTSGPWQIEIIGETLNADGDPITEELDQPYALVASYIPALEVPLIEGWQLISLPLEQEDTSFDEVLRSIDPYYDTIRYYDASDAADPWKQWKRNKPFGNDLTDLNHEMGFWLYILGISEITLYVYGLDFTVNYGTQGYVPVSLSMNAGSWNMVGYPSDIEKQRDAGLKNLKWGIHIDLIQWYDAEGEVWRTLEDTDNFELGRGYWFHMLQLPSPPEWQVPLGP